MLGLAARQGRLLMVAALALAIAVPGLAALVRPWLPLLIALLLGLAAFRIGARLSLGSRAGLVRAGSLVLLFQVALPLVALALLTAFGVAGTLPAAALMLVLAGSSISGSPNFTVLLGHDPAMALRLLLLGTALLPISAVPILALVPDLIAPEEVRVAALRLGLVVAGTVAAGFALRTWAGEVRAKAWQTSIDGTSSLLLAIMVLGLMTAMGPGLREAPLAVLGWAGFTCAVNFGLQILAWTVLPLPGEERAGAAYVAGNRNIALFLVALPAGVTDPLLLFIGAYQLPMYLTPVLMGWLYRGGRARA